MNAKERRLYKKFGTIRKRYEKLHKEIALSIIAFREQAKKNPGDPLTYDTALRHDLVALGSEMAQAGAWLHDMADGTDRRRNTIVKKVRKALGYLIP